MYIKLVRRIVEESVGIYAASNGMSEEEVRSRIWEHIQRTSQEHFTDDPTIDYQDPLCRVGYLYRHAAANATLFEHVLKTADEVSRRVHESAGNVLYVCAVGGGPGTELLGIGKYLLGRPHLPMPTRIDFTVLDSVPQWSETWMPLAEAVEEQISLVVGSNGTAPVIARSFLPMNVLDPCSYMNYAYQFSRADIVVCNYLFSENKTRLNEAGLAVKRLATITPPGCRFVVIDRLEQNTQFMDEVVALFESVFAAKIQVSKFNGTLTKDEETGDMGPTLLKAFKKPRVKFFTDYYSRRPTVFWFDVELGKS